MLIRRAQPGDVPEVLALVRAVVPLMRAAGNLQWDDAYPNAAVFGRDVELGQLWLAEVDSELAGVAALTAEQEPEYGHVGWDPAEPSIVVHRLAVDPRFRGRGVAVALLLHAEEVARENGMGVVRLDTNALNPAAQALFLRLGYSFAGEITLAFRPGMRVLCYEKRFGP